MNGVNMGVLGQEVKRKIEVTLICNIERNYFFMKCFFFSISFEKAIHIQSNNRNYIENGRGYF